MVKYDGYVNSFLDQYAFFKKKHKNDLNFFNNQDVKSMYQFFDYAMHLAEKSIKFKLPDNAELFDFKDDMLIADVLKKYVGIELHLPYRLTCLEFLIKLHGEAEPVIIFAEEKDEDIYILMSIKDQSNEWGLMYNSYVKMDNKINSIMTDNKKPSARCCFSKNPINLPYHSTYFFNKKPLLKEVFYYLIVRLQ